MLVDKTIELLTRHLGKPKSGKVRETFSIARDVMAPYVSGRLSSHDFPLGFSFKQKAEVLNAMDIHWKKKLEAAGVPTDLIAYGSNIDTWLPAELQGNRELWKTLTIRRRLDIILVECIGRFVLDGSMWKAYARGEREFCGYRLTEGLQRGAELSPALFTPTTKAEKGHDKPRDAAEVMKEHPGLADFTMHILDLMDRELTEGGRAKIGDTKFEIGYDFVTRRLTLGDETGTPDSSRIYELQPYLKRSPGTMPPNFDKEYIRAEMERMGILNYDPENPADRDYVRTYLIPRQDVIQEASRRYLYAAELTFGKSLHRFQIEDMRIPAE